MRTIRNLRQFCGTPIPFRTQNFQSHSLPPRIAGFPFGALIPLYYFDIIQHIGGITEYFYSIALIFILISLIIVFILNYSCDKDYEWFEIIKVLNSSQSSNSFKLKDKNEFKNHLIKNLKIMFNLFFLSSLPFTIILALTILLIFKDFDYPYLINYGILYWDWLYISQTLFH